MLRPIYNDELYHHGVIGMKWGKRAASSIKEGIKAQNQASKDMLRHPIHSTAAQISMLKKNPIRTIKGGTKVLNELNADVKKRVKNKDITRNQIKSGADKTHKLISKIGKNAIKLHQQMQVQAMADQIFR